MTRVNNALICPNDDVIYSGAECPLCLSRLGHPLRTWLCPMNPIVGGKHEPTVHRRAEPLVGSSVLLGNLLAVQKGKQNYERQ